MNDIGVIGMAVMGSNLALNMADHGFKVSIYNRTQSVTDEVYAQHSDKSIEPFYTIEQFVASLTKPRRVMIMVKAGKPVDLVIDELLAVMDEGDIIMDGGNSFYRDTMARYARVNARKIHYLGVGISGGEEGARFGPSIMPGGDLVAYQSVEPVLTAISAKAFGEACVTYIGDNGAGHYVKMVHNGIEYGDMQLIAESYFLLKHVAGLNNQELAEVYQRWNKGKLNSFLIEITAHIFTVKDEETGADLIDIILDRAGQKGTGKWTAMESADLGVATTIITAALYARYLSAIKDERVRASEILQVDVAPLALADRAAFIDQVENALYLSKVISYAQGFSLLDQAAKTYQWTLDFAAIARIWRGGCIIRASFLNDISSAFARNPQTNLLLDPQFVTIAQQAQGDLRKVVVASAQAGLSSPAFMNALSYFDSYRQPLSSANLIQAQRDLFGAHTFERTDRSGSFHANWGEMDGE